METDTYLYLKALLIMTFMLVAQVMLCLASYGRFCVLCSLKWSQTVCLNMTHILNNHLYIKVSFPRKREHVQIYLYLASTCLKQPVFLSFPEPIEDWRHLKGNWQTVHTQIRCRRTRRLIRAPLFANGSTICSLGVSTSYSLTYLKYKTKINK